MKVLFDDITKYIVRFDDEDISTGKDLQYINKLTKSDIDFEECENGDIIVYR